MATGWLIFEIAIIVVPIFTLFLGVLIGYLAQRSGFCSIGGMRDLMMFKHTRLFIGYLALIGGGFLGYLIFWLIAPMAFPGFFWAFTASNPLQPVPGAPPNLIIVGYLILAIIGGFGMGLLGVLLGGCPLRQTVMGSEGNLRSISYVVGMLIGAVIFHLWIVSLAQAIFGG
ncbi:MAG: YeeE/YedE family protein [Candidatus Lokiarchaeota archaeon]|nr:YeeE/YedE family protein [Candidatus Lokiarchaeota archaeon]MBD3339477.1 YeeE/YedE family protein [Candidatus Lokiarchaeota archaeon]